MLAVVSALPISGRGGLHGEADKPGHRLADKELVALHDAPACRAEQLLLDSAPTLLVDAVEVR